ncbi:putative integral membrane protein [Rubellimicrobium mesophilum DSM 19309]|uniref:Putative integral membrane protein n=1 Tax=Rubellimicrobium mesophilum DSM 19309 TaxID=442562 RepID=A0A017HV90_9RHOB|nr:ZIP family zinc transporter [Rubellimicrobium mesophilum]EYD78250.1 putative integral membrane protein [Rubellimicrobium mesophilum DSM 19309]
MAVWVQAGLRGLLGGSALVIGAALAYIANLPRRVTASIMAFGCGVLISAVAYDLILEGFELASFRPILIGTVVGSLAYTGANWLVSQGAVTDKARHRKRSGEQQTDAGDGGGLAIAVGSLLDGIPESVVLGVGLLSGGGVSLAVLSAIFLSNLPEGLSSAVGMRKAGRSALYVFGLWIGIAVASGLASAAGAALMGGASPDLLAMVSALAAGALLTMIADTMVPEAVEGEGGLAGLFVVLGLLTAFALSKVLGGG